MLVPANWRTDRISFSSFDCIIIIQRDIQRIRRNKSKTVTLIKQLHESDIQNRELILSRKKAIHGYAKLIQGHGKDSAIRYAESILQAS